MNARLMVLVVLCGTSAAAQQTVRVEVRDDQGSPVGYAHVSPVGGAAQVATDSGVVTFRMRAADSLNDGDDGLTEPVAFPPDRGLGSIDYSQAPKAVYYVDGAGERWRVHDCVFEQGKLRRVGLPGTACATRRVFVNAAGLKRLYVRSPREIWEATVAHLARQLNSAGYLPTESFSPEHSAPRRSPRQGRPAQERQSGEAATVRLPRLASIAL